MRTTGKYWHRMSYVWRRVRAAISAVEAVWSQARDTVSWIGEDCSGETGGRIDSGTVGCAESSLLMLSMREIASKSNLWRFKLSWGPKDNSGRRCCTTRASLRYREAKLKPYEVLPTGRPTGRETTGESSEKSVESFPWAYGGSTAYTGTTGWGSGP